MTPAPGSAQEPADPRRAITSAADLDTLPVDAVVDCGGGDVYTKPRDGQWVGFAYDRESYTEPLSSEGLWYTHMEDCRVKEFNLPRRCDEMPNAHEHVMFVHWLPKVSS